MLVHSLYRQRPLRIASVLAAVAFVWLCLSYSSEYVTVPSRSRGGGEVLSDVQRPTQDAEYKQPPSLSGDGMSRIAKVTVAANKLDSEVIHRALQTHKLHNARHGYKHFIAMNEAVSGLIENDRYKRPRGAWTKPAYLLAILVDELQKPESERLEWLLYVIPPPP